MTLTLSPLAVVPAARVAGCPVDVVVSVVRLFFLNTTSFVLFRFVPLVGFACLTRTKKRRQRKFAEAKQIE